MHVADRNRGDFCITEDHEPDAGQKLKLLEGKDPIVPFIPSSLTTVPSTGCSTEQVPPKSSVTGAAFIPQ